MAKLTSDQLYDAFKNMTMVELSEFVRQFEDTFGVTAAPPVAVAAPAGPAAGAADVTEEQDEFDVILESAGEKKVQVIMAVRELVSGLGLKEAKDLVDAAPKIILGKATFQAARAAKSKLEAAGAKAKLDTELVHPVPDSEDSGRLRLVQRMIEDLEQLPEDVDPSDAVDVVTSLRSTNPLNLSGSASPEPDSSNVGRTGSHSPVDQSSAMQVQTVISDLTALFLSSEEIGSVVNVPMHAIARPEAYLEEWTSEKLELATNVVAIGVTFAQIWDSSLYSAWLKNKNAHLDYARPLDLALNNPEEIKQAIYSAAFGVYS